MRDEALHGCPLCAEPAPARADEEIPWERVWRALHEEWNARVPADEIARHEAGGVLRRVRCPRCALDYFEGARAGSAAFYTALEAGGKYYAPHRWEFDWAAARIPRGALVLDVGCGRGDFLALVRAAGAHARGVEHNPTACAAARDRGFDVTDRDLDTLASAGERVDVGTAFHVLEHTTDPLGFLRSLAGCVRDGGELLLSVPFRDRRWREDFEVLEHPPHHLTRWALPQLRQLAEASALQLVEHAFEPLARALHRHAVEKSLHRALARRVPYVGGALGAAVGWAASRAAFAPGLIHLVDAFGLRARLGARGLAVVVRMRKPT